MSQAAGNIDDADASHLWDQLSERIDGFATAWQQGGEPPKLADFLPEAPGALRRLTLIEAIKIDLEYRWQAGPTPKRVEDYVAEFPELLGSGGVPCDIIYEEYHIRKQRGDAVAPAEYFERFPDRVEELRRLLQLETPEQTTALVASEPVPVFEVGERVDDFELISKLGKGAFATVFLARQVSMQRLVALKISRDRGFEPQTLAQLEHQNIVRVYDQRQLAAGKLRLLYMQYVQAGTLQSVVEHAKKVPPALRSGATLLESIDQSLAKNNEQPPTDSMTRHRLQRASWYEVVCWLGARLASALSYAHGRGVLHRDVKPANVLVGADGQPKLADFNISFSKLDGATPAAYFGGSLAYMSPEQLEACDPAHARQPEELDGRSDVYSLGIMLWELLVLRRPFAEDSLPQTWSNALAKMTTVRRGGISPEVIAAVPRDCPRAIVDVLLKCLEPEVEKRYASAAELSRELDLCLQPRAHALLHGASWRAVAKRHPVVTTVLVGVLPNIVMCFVNIGYNWDQIMAGLSIADQNVFLYTIIMGINTLSYAVGLGYVFITRGRLFKNLMQLARGQKVDPPPSDETIRRCLTLGSATAGITAMLWTASGFVIPAWMYMQAGESSTLTFEDYRHFVISGLLCGMIAATQSYFLVTFLCIRFDFPWLVQARGGEALQLTALAEVPRRNRLFLALTVAVPIVALTAFALLNLQAEGEVVGSNVIAALGIMGMVGCGLAYLLDLTIRADVGALAASMNPNSDALMSTDTLDSFLSGTRR